MSSDMAGEISEICSELDAIRKEQDELRKRQQELSLRSAELDRRLNQILHSHIDPLVNGRWSVRFTLYPDRHATS
jgi:predicted transcriptional regulator